MKGVEKGYPAPVQTGRYIGTLTTGTGRIDVFADRRGVEVQATMPKEILSSAESAMLREHLELAEIAAKAMREPR